MTTPAEFTPIPASAADYAPRAWVGCLGCYNEGRLTGDWVAALDASEFVPCKRVDHEEWWVFDHEGFDGFLTGECAPMDAQDLADALRAVRAVVRVPGRPCRGSLKQASAQEGRYLQGATARGSVARRQESTRQARLLRSPPTPQALGRRREN